MPFADDRSQFPMTMLAALDPGPLTEDGGGTHVAPLFSRVLAENRHRIYLANHSLGRPLDAMADVVVSQVMFQTGQVLPRLSAIVARAHEVGARILLDVYHSLGVFPIDVTALDVDFAVGGSYKYLRGGTGACYLYVHPRHLDIGLRSLDTGWFAKESPFHYQRPDPPRYASGGDAWLESTPAILPFYQARAGQMLTLALGVDRLRAYSIGLQRTLVAELAERGVRAQGGTEDRGAFVIVRVAGDAGAASRCVEALADCGVVADARGEWLRLCPDVLTTADEILRAAAVVADVLVTNSR